MRTIGNGDAVNADFNAIQTLVAITTVKGKVEIRKENGALVRTIGNGHSNNARWSGADLVLTTVKRRNTNPTAERCIDPDAVNLHAHAL